MFLIGVLDGFTKDVKQTDENMQTNSRKCMDFSTIAVYIKTHLTLQYMTYVPILYYINKIA
jgi:hypothetical protein